MTELVKNAPVYNFLPSIKYGQIAKACVIPFGFRKGKKLDKLFVSSSDIEYMFFNQRLLKFV